MNTVIKKNILIVIIGLGLVPFQCFSMFQKFTPKLASMDKETLKKVDEAIQKIDQVLKTAPQIVNQITQQFTELLQGSNELGTLKEILNKLNILLTEIDDFSNRTKNLASSVKTEFDSRGLRQPTQNIIADYLNTSADCETKEKKQLEELAEILKNEEFKSFVNKKVNPFFESAYSSLNALLKQIQAISDDIPVEEANKKNREQRQKSIARLCENLDKFLKLMGIMDNLGLEPKLIININLKMKDLTILREGLEQFKNELEKIIEQFRKNSFGVGLYESLDNKITELTDKLNNVVYNFSLSVSAESKEIIGFPVILKIRKQLIILISRQASQKEIKSSLQDIETMLKKFIETLEQGPLHDQLVTFNGKLQSLLDIPSINDDQLRRLDKDLDEILNARSGLLGALAAIADEMKDKLNVVVDRFNEHNIKLIDTNIPRAGKKILCYVPFVATATLSALWLSYQLFNEQLDRAKFLKGSSVFMASLAALPCVDYAMDYFKMPRFNKK